MCSSIIDHTPLHCHFWACAAVLIIDHTPLHCHFCNTLHEHLLAISHCATDAHLMSWKSLVWGCLTGRGRGDDAESYAMQLWLTNESKKYTRLFYVPQGGKILKDTSWLLRATLVTLSYTHKLNCVYLHRQEEAQSTAHWCRRVSPRFRSWLPHRQPSWSISCMSRQQLHWRSC